MEEVLVVLGTRPEAVKLRPVLAQARAHPDWAVRVCMTGQHPAALVQAAAEATDGADALAPPPPGHNAATGRQHMRAQLASRLAVRPPALVLAQGDTSSVLAAARAAADAAVPFVHLEAGLRTFDRHHPFPEEDIRVEVATLASLHLAPTWSAFEHLRCEGISAEAIVVTGNTAVDAVRHQVRTMTSRHHPPSSLPQSVVASLGRRRGWILVTHHRQESLPGGLRAVRDAVVQLAAEHPEMSVVWPVHPNPRIAAELSSLRGIPGLCLAPPLPHGALLWLLRGASLVITDSGGIQEEAPEFGVPVLVTRRCTERMEAVRQGIATLVGHDRGRIVAAARAALMSPGSTRRCGRDNPFGDGAAAKRCVAALRWKLQMPGAGRPRSWRPQLPGHPPGGATVGAADDLAWRLLSS